MIKSVLSRFLGGSLQARIMQSGAAVLVSEVYSSGLRLVSNLIMTRLLYPEAFGLMLIVNLLIMALGLLSDVGIRSAIVSRTKPIDERFLNTAWTMLLVRGALLSLATLILAYPVSVFYGEPQLFPLILLTACMPIISGMGSPHGMMYEKKVELIRPIIWGTVSSTATAVITLTWLFIHPTIWALAANGIISAIISASTSYYFFPGHRPRICWDRTIVGELFRFGRWVVVATALTFMARQGDSLIVSKAITTEQLGTFSIAVALSKLLDQVVSRLNWSVLVPAYSELHQTSKDSDGARRKRLKIKLAMFALSAPIILAFCVFGRDIIGIMYDPRYQNAGWILEILGVGALFFAVGAPIRTLPMAFGDSYRYMWQQFYTVATLISSMLIGAHFGGFVGLIVGIAAAQAIEYFVARWSVSKYGIGNYGPDIIFAAVMSGLIVLAWSIRGWPGPA